MAASQGRRTDERGKAAAGAYPLTVDEVVDEYVSAHEELLAELAGLLTEGDGHDWLQPEYIDQRLKRANGAVNATRAHIVGPDGGNGLAAEVAYTSYATGLVLAGRVATTQGADTDQTADESEQEGPAERMAAEATEAADARLGAVRRMFRSFGRRALSLLEAAGGQLGKLVPEIIVSLIQRAIRRLARALLRRLRTWVDYIVRGVLDTVFKAVRQAAEWVTQRIGWDLVVVVGPIDMKTCDTCADAVGQIFSRSGRDAAYPALSELFHKDPPLGHPGCRHTWWPYLGPRGRLSAEQVQRRSEHLLKRTGLAGEEGTSYWQHSWIQRARVLDRAERSSDPWVRSLRHEERDAVYRWTEGRYWRRIQECQRTGRGSPTARQVTRDLERALDKARPVRGTVYRGSHDHTIGDIEELSIRERSGQPWQWETCVSSSTKRSVAEKFATKPPIRGRGPTGPGKQGNIGILFRIKQHNGVRISELSPRPDQQEVVLRTGVRYDVQGMTDLGTVNGRPLWLVDLAQQGQ